MLRDTPLYPDITMIPDHSEISDSYKQGCCILSYLKRQTATFPHNVALIDGFHHFTFSELDFQSNALALRISNEKKGTSPLIGLCFSRSFRLIVAMLAVLKSGHAFIYLDPSLPTERMQFIIDDANLDTVLTDTDVQLFPFKGHIIPWETPLVPSSKLRNDTSSSKTEGRDPAYVIYTSGSTGLPKGVLISRESLYYFIESVQCALPMLKTDIYLHTASFQYALSIRQLFVPLCLGIPVVLAPMSLMQDPLLFFNFIQSRGITLIDLVPSQWRGFNNALSLLEKEQRTRLLNNRLRRIVSIGEALYSDIPFQWQKEFKHPAELINIFGLSESTGMISYFKINPDDSPEGASIPIGRPVKHMTLYALSTSLEEVKKGETGNVYIGGKSLFTGYLNRPELTAEKCTSFANLHESGRLFASGDGVILLPSGNYRFSGRQDLQIKTRGMRIELEEIEVNLLKYPGITECAVIAMEGASDTKLLHGYLCTNTINRIDPCDLKAFLNQSLQSHMIPVSFTFMDKLPRTTGGKIDRLALHSLSQQRIQPVLPSDAKVSENGMPSKQFCLKDIETELLRIWQHLLQVSPITLEDNFFKIGGFSLLGVQLLVEIEKRFGKRLPVSSLLIANTIKAQAELINSETDTAVQSLLVPIKPKGSKPPLFLLHHADGGVLDYRELAELFDDDQPVYGIQSLCGNAPVLTMNPAEAATTYCQEILMLQPHGPYLIGGHSYGGKVAFEVARQLSVICDKSHHSLSVPVPKVHLILFDACAPDCVKLPSYRVAFYMIKSLLAKSMFHSRRIAKLPLLQWKFYFEEKKKSVKQQLRVLHKTIKRRKKRKTMHQGMAIVNQKQSLPMPINPSPEIMETPFTGNLLLFRASLPLPVMERKDYGWSRYCTNNITILTVKGEHGNLIKGKGARTITAHIQNYIENLGHDQQQF